MIASVLHFFLYGLLPPTVALLVFYTLLERLKASLAERGIVPTSIPTEEEVRSWERKTEQGAEAPRTMRDHMQIVDTHLLRAQDYVVALGADGNAEELALLFKKIRGARRALRVVSDGRAVVRGPVI